MIDLLPIYVGGGANDGHFYLSKKNSWPSKRCFERILRGSSSSLTRYRSIVGVDEIAETSSPETSV